MKIYNSLILLFLGAFFNIAIAQTNHVAIYNVQYHFDNDEVGNRYSSFFNSATDNADQVIITLVFNTQKSYCYINDEDINSNNKMAFSLTGLSKPIFMNVNANTITSHNEKVVPLGIEDDQYLLTDVLQDKTWQLHNESKNINGNIAYKATRTYTNEKNTTNTIVAWYAPEIPYSYGPITYGGLPGLIIEVHEGNKMFTLSKLTFNQNVEIPEPPKSGEVISRMGFILKNMDIINDRVKQIK